MRDFHVCNSLLFLEIWPLWLVSPVKPILAVAVLAVTGPFPPIWKRTDRLLLGRNKWNTIHMSAGIMAVLSELFVPIFWIGWPLAMVLCLPRFRLRQCAESEVGQAMGTIELPKAPW